MIYDPRRATSLLLKETDDSYTRPGRDRFIKVRTLSEKINPYDKNNIKQFLNTKRQRKSSEEIQKEKELKLTKRKNLYGQHP